MPNANDAGSGTGLMRCAWRDIASYADVAWLPLFIGFWLFMFWAFFFVERPWRRARYGRWWWLGPRALSRGERHSFEQWLRDTGQGWLLRTRSLWIAAFLLVFAWPFVSPTFCENVKCAGYKALKPRTECLPQSASRCDGVGSWEPIAGARDTAPSSRHRRLSPYRSP
jgi:hypothetical protein